MKVTFTKNDIITVVSNMKRSFDNHICVCCNERGGDIEIETALGIYSDNKGLARELISYHLYYVYGNVFSIEAISNLDEVVKAVVALIEQKRDFIQNIDKIKVKMSESIEKDIKDILLTYGIHDYNQSNVGKLSIPVFNGELILDVSRVDLPIEDDLTLEN